MDCPAPAVQLCPWGNEVPEYVDEQNEEFLVFFSTFEPTNLTPGQPSPLYYRHTSTYRIRWCTISYMMSHVIYTIPEAICGWLSHWVRVPGHILQAKGVCQYYEPADPPCLYVGPADNCVCRASLMEC